MYTAVSIQNTVSLKKSILRKREKTCFCQNIQNNSQQPNIIYMVKYILAMLLTYMTLIAIVFLMNYWRSKMHYNCHHRLEKLNMQ